MIAISILQFYYKTNNTIINFFQFHRKNIDYVSFNLKNGVLINQHLDYIRYNKL